MPEYPWIPAGAGMTFDKPTGAKYVTPDVTPAQAGVRCLHNLFPMTQKILQPGEIGEHQPFPNVVLPSDPELFANRARRFSHLAHGHAMQPLLAVLGKLSQAQHLAFAAREARRVPDEVLQQFRDHGMPALSYQAERSSEWQRDLEHVLQTLKAGDEAVLKEAAQKLDAFDEAGRESIADAIFGGGIAGGDEHTHAMVAPLVGAALQVWWTRQAASMTTDDVGLIGASTVCPVCASRPVASVIEVAPDQSNLRYLHCSLCSTQWHMVRVTCTACESTKNITYLSLNGVEADEPSRKIAFARAEACDDCHTYLKIFSREKEPMMEVGADDLATLTLDMLTDEAGYLRSGPNLLFSPGVPESE